MTLGQRELWVLEFIGVHSQRERESKSRRDRQTALLYREYLCLIGSSLTILCVCVCYLLSDKSWP